MKPLEHFHNCDPSKFSNKRMTSRADNFRTLEFEHISASYFEYSIQKGNHSNIQIDHFGMTKIETGLVSWQPADAE